MDDQLTQNKKIKRLIERLSGKLEEKEWLLDNILHNGIPFNAQKISSLTRIIKSMIELMYGIRHFDMLILGQRPSFPTLPFYKESEKKIRKKCKIPDSVPIIY